MVRSLNIRSLYITGLAHEYPSHSFGRKDFENLIKKLYPTYSTSLGLKKLVQLNRKTQIRSRRSVFDISKWTKDDVSPPSIDAISRLYQNLGVHLAASACTKAMKEAQVSFDDITHIVAVTCTNQGNPGYDILVCQDLKLSPTVQRVLLHGVGCAGGLSALRTAANIASAESQRGRSARVLALHIAPAIFSNAAAALVLCNSTAMKNHQKPIHELLEWGSMAVPGTTSQMTYDVEADGMIATMTKDIPKIAVGAIQPMFDRLRATTPKAHNQSSWTNLKLSNFDWAIHPGGAVILQGAQHNMRLTDDHIRASLETYRNYGNSSSPTVLVVIDKLRHMGEGRGHVVATSFGPGMMIEMCVLKRSLPESPLSQFSNIKNLFLSFYINLYNAPRRFEAQAPLSDDCNTCERLI
ncbi:thiolase-like protein [Ophiobolus disseminans]|uniref:Thiolase-like protein n=1 Tax=Ophiobolus disseminans TaxID=1469910 RepID=A0A6A7A0P0_9PLEO|nr:thiolase-like protein [Ophiobolus disseminans]